MTAESEFKSKQIINLMAGGLTREQARKQAGLRQRKRYGRVRHDKPLATIEPWRCPCGRLVKVAVCLECEADKTKESTLETTRLLLERERLGIG